VVRRLMIRGLLPLGLVGAILLGGHWLIRDGVPMARGRDGIGETWTVVPGSVYDGDTLRVQRQGREERLRLCGIDAPEMAQPLGPEARDHLRGLLAGHDEVLLMAVERDRYGRLVAEIWTGADGVNDVNVNSQMVLDGYAFHYAQYSGNCPNRLAIMSAELIAQDEGLGVWAVTGMVPPWEWRRQQQG
jgi:endonuclease YncB( thermonuclease family)